MTSKHINNPCKSDTYHSPMLKLLLDLNTRQEQQGGMHLELIRH